MGVATAEVPPLTTAIKEVDEQGRITLRQVELFGPVTKEAMEQATQSTQTFAGAMKTAADIRFEKAIQALTEATLEYGNNLRDHLHPQLIRYLENLGLLAKRTQEAEKNTKGLSETAKMLGHYINELGKEVNAYGNEIARTTEQTQKLLDLQIRVKTPFADDLAGLQKQLQQANADLLALGNRIPQLGYEGYKQQQKVLLDLIAELEKRIAALKQTASSSGGGTTTGGTTTTTRPTGSTGGGSVTVTGPPAGSSGSGSGSVIVGGGNAPLSSIPVTTTQRSGATYNLTIQTQATDAATLARDLVPYLRQADLSSRRIGG
jgi:chromosome segregation ATPase